MVGRGRGLIIVVGTLAPFIAFAVIGIATVVAVGSIKASAEQYGTVVKAELADATQSFRDVGSALDDVGMFVTDITDSVGGAVAGLGEISPEVRLPTAPIQIPRTRLIDLPTVLGSSCRPSIFQRRRFAVPEPIDQIAKETSALASDVRSTANVWLMVTLITLVLTASAWLVNRVGLWLSEVKRGWSLMMGRTAPAAATVARMRARLQEMEAQLATLDV